MPTNDKYNKIKEDIKNINSDIAKGITGFGHEVKYGTETLKNKASKALDNLTEGAAFAKHDFIQGAKEFTHEASQSFETIKNDAKDFFNNDNNQ